MRYRIKEYTIGGDTDFFVSGKIGVEDIRLIINETQKKVICSSMNKSNVACEYVEDMDATFISFSSSICILQPSDKLTIEVDKGDTLTQVASKVEEESEAIKSKIDAIPATDLTAVAKEETLNTLADKIDNIKLPEIDTTELAKQGENKNATNSKIYDAVKGIPDLSLLYSARFEKNDDGEDTYSMVLPIVAGVIANEDGETVTIKL